MRLSQSQRLPAGFRSSVSQIWTTSSAIRPQENVKLFHPLLSKTGGGAESRGAAWWCNERAPVSSDDGLKAGGCSCRSGPNCKAGILNVLEHLLTHRKHSSSTGACGNVPSYAGICLNQICTAVAGRWDVEFPPNHKQGSPVKRRGFQPCN